MHNNIPAFPTTSRNGNFGEDMTLRDHFAGLAMQACIARGDDSNRLGIAEWAYRMADAMLTERLMK